MLAGLRGLCCRLWPILMGPVIDVFCYKYQIRLLSMMYQVGSVCTN